MAYDCGLSCNSSFATLRYSPIDEEGSAPLWDEGELVTFDIDEMDLEEHTDHTGTLLIRSGKNVKMTNVTVTLFPCSRWYKALYSAYMDNTLVCGDLLVDDPCCDKTLVAMAGIKKMGRKPVSNSSVPTQVIFRGVLKVA